MEILIPAEKTFKNIECYTCSSEDNYDCSCYGKCEVYPDKNGGCSGFCRDW